MQSSLSQLRAAPCLHSCSRTKLRCQTRAQAAPAQAGPKTIMQVLDGRFTDYRWVGGRWELDQFKQADGSTNWNEVIDAEMGRRKLLEDAPVASINDDPVNFDTDEIPWWAWVQRFHLPEAEKINGRACMVGYATGYFVDKLTGHGLVDQQSSFLGKLLIFVTVVSLLVFRNQASVGTLKGLFDEATFYDRQWQATWDGQQRPSESET